MSYGRAHPTPERVPAFVFVYGTLRRDEHETAALTHARVDRTGRYPTITPSADPNDRVIGQLSPVENEAAIRDMDRYEAVNVGLYARLTVTDAVDVYIGEPEMLNAAEATHSLDDLDELREHFAERAEILRGDAIEPEPAMEAE